MKRGAGSASILLFVILMFSFNILLFGWSNDFVNKITGKSTNEIDSKTKLLLHMDDVGLTDAIGHSVTLNGNVARSSAQSKFGSYSAYFDGNDDYLTIPDSDDWNLGTGDFTIDMWVYFPSGERNCRLIMWGSQFNLQFYVGDTHNLYINSEWAWLNKPLSLPTNQWVHVALVRSGTDFSLYINGIKIYNAVNSKSISSDMINIGSNGGSNAVGYYIDELRISKGVARWTSNFQPPTSAYSSSSSSSTSQASTTTSSSSSSSSSGSIDSNTKLLLHMDDAGLTDSSASAHTITLNGNAARSSAQSKFGSYSAYFDGNGDYLSVPDSDDWDLGTGDFTIDTWIRFNSITDYPSIVATTDLDAGNAGFNLFYYAPTHTLKFYTTGGGSFDQITISIPWNPLANTWYHIAIVRSFGDVKIYINGEQIGTTATGQTYDLSSTDSVFIGKQPKRDVYFNGYIDELRISKGVARWTSNFQPPTSAYSSSSSSSTSQTSTTTSSTTTSTQNTSSTSQSSTAASTNATASTQTSTATSDSSSQTGIITQEGVCQGCEYEERCLPIGTRLSINSENSFCSIEQKFEIQKSEGIECSNNYECLTNQCSSSKCVDISKELNVLNKIMNDIWGFLKGVFGGGE